MSNLNEAVDYNDPLSILLAREGESCDELESCYRSALHRARCSEPERQTGDWLGASPFELASRELEH